MDPDHTLGSGLATRRSLLKTIGVGSAVATVGISPLAISGASAQECSGPVPTELIGRFVDTFGHRHIITENPLAVVPRRQRVLSSHIARCSRWTGFLITRNHASQTFHPNKFSRFEWLVEDGDLWYCQQVFSRSQCGKKRPISTASRQPMEAIRAVAVCGGQRRFFPGRSSWRSQRSHFPG